MNASNQNQTSHRISHESNHITASSDKISIKWPLRHGRLHDFQNDCKCMNGRTWAFITQVLHAKPEMKNQCRSIERHRYSYVLVFRPLNDIQSLGSSSAHQQSWESKESTVQSTCKSLRLERGWTPSQMERYKARCHSISVDWRLNQFEIIYLLHLIRWITILFLFAKIYFILSTIFISLMNHEKQYIKH